MLLIGMLVVFLVLIIIWGCLVLFKIGFSNTKTDKKKDAAPVEKPAVTQQNNDGEIIAAIAAAIAMAESESDGLKFRVVSFRRK